MTRVQKWSALTAAAVLVVLAAGWFLLVSPQRAHASELRTQADGARSSNAQLTEKIARLREQKKDLPQQQAELAAIATKIPNDPALPSLIRGLSDAADSAGVDLQSLAPGAPAAVSPSTTTGATTATTASTSGASTTATTASAGAGAVSATPPLEQIPLTITVTGSYFNIAQFFSNAENLSRALSVSGLQLGTGTAAGSSGSSGSSTASGAAAKSNPGDLTATINARVFLSPAAATPSTASTATPSTTHPTPTATPATS